MAAHVGGMWSEGETRSGVASQDLRARKKEIWIFSHRGHQCALSLLQNLPRPCRWGFRTQVEAQPWAKGKAEKSTRVPSTILSSCGGENLLKALYREKNQKDYLAQTSQFIDEDTRALREGTNLNFCPPEFKHMPLHMSYRAIFN